jgi:glycosyltransferase involved in cell wall biosynthesis
MNESKLAIVVPCYNEEETLPSTITRLLEVLNELISQNEVSNESFLYFVDDGSADKTWQIIEEAHAKNHNEVKGLKFTKNFGNQNALIAGLESVNNIGIDCAITIDADLQQDETKIKEFVQKFKQGAQIVSGIRKDRKADGFFKKTTAILFYKLMNLLGVKIPPNHSEYRLMGKQALDIISNYKEAKLFLRGLFYELGLKTDHVYFDVKKREHGESKFNFISLMRLAAYGIVSFSVRPLRFVFLTGLIISIVSFVVGIVGFYLLIVQGKHLPGYEPFQIFQTFIGGLQILCTGIIGEYVGLILEEVKARPRYVKDKELK